MDSNKNEMLKLNKNSLAFFERSLAKSSCLEWPDHTCNKDKENTMQEVLDCRVPDWKIAFIISNHHLK